MNKPETAGPRGRVILSADTLALFHFNHRMPRRLFEEKKPEVDCRKVNLAKKIDLCANENADLSDCYMQCLSAKSYAALDNACEDEKPYMLGCLATNCASFKMSDIRTEDKYVNFIRFSSVLKQCDEQKAKKLEEQINAAMEADKDGSFSVCCGVNKVGALVGGLIAAIVVLAVAGVFLWLFLAKKWIFAPKNKVQVAENNATEGENEAGAAPAVAQ